MVRNTKGHEKEEPKLRAGMQVLQYERPRRILSKMEAPWSGPYLILRCLDFRHYEIRTQGRVIRVRGDDLSEFISHDFGVVARESV